jgi:hypothetical protein
MKTYPSRPTLNSSLAPVSEVGSSRIALHYFVGGFVCWLMGIQASAGWHIATTGSPNFAKSLGEGLIAIVLGAGITAIARKAKFNRPQVSNGVGLALAIIVVEASMPVGLLLGSMWNAIGGSYPDMSGVGNIASMVIG